MGRGGGGDFCSNKLPCFLFVSFSWEGRSEEGSSIVFLSCTETNFFFIFLKGEGGYLFLEGGWGWGWGMGCGLG